MKIKTIEMAEKALYRISKLDSDLSAAQIRTDCIVSDAKNAYAAYSKSLEEEKTILIDALHTFTDGKRDELLRGQQSAALINGIIGYRKGKTTISVGTETADKLLSAGLDAFVKIEKKPVVSALANLPDNELAHFDAERIPGTEIFYVKANTLRSTDDNPAA